jgi:hypothetical protein
MANSFTLAIPKDVLAAKESEAGIDPNATSGTLPESHGVQLSYVVTSTAGNLVAIEFTVVHKPALVSLSMIKSHVKGLLGI